MYPICNSVAIPHIGLIVSVAKKIRQAMTEQTTRKILRRSRPAKRFYIAETKNPKPSISPYTRFPEIRFPNPTIPDFQALTFERRDFRNYESIIFNSASTTVQASIS